MSAHMMRGASQKTYKHRQQTCIRPRCTTTANFPDPHNPFGKKKAVCGSCRNKALRELDSSPGFDVYGHCKNVHIVWKSVPAPVLGLPTRRPEDRFSTECYVPTVLRILFSREHYRTSTSRFSTVHYIPTVLRFASRFSTVHYIPTVLGFPPQWMY